MKKYWKSLEELKEANNSEAVGGHHNGSNGISLIDMLDKKNNASRRDFLKLFGFSITSAAILSSCERPVTKAIPYLIKPEEVTLGKASYYASTFYDGLEFNSVLVKVRDGRPIKIEGNELSPITKGGTSANVQASVLSLYDETRYKSPQFQNETISWETADNEIKSKLRNISNRGGRIVLLSRTIISPGTKQAIKEFTQAYPGSEHVVYDSDSYSAMLEANEKSFGKRSLPQYRFDKAKIIVGFSADFLGTWISPVEFTKQYVKNRKVNHENKSMSRHLHFESGLSLTGSNADERFPVKPSEIGPIVVKLYNEIAKKLGEDTLSAPETFQEVHAVAEELIANSGKALVVCGVNDPNIQIVVNGINKMLGSYGNTVDLSKDCYLKQGSDLALNELTETMDKGEVDAILFYDTNPVFESPIGETLSQSIPKVELSISLNTIADETSALCKYVCPDSHYLESWNDAQPYANSYSLAQPAIRTIFDTRQAQESLLLWSGNTTPYLDYLKDYWQANIFSKIEADLFFQDFWMQSLHDGIVELKLSTGAQPNFDKVQVAQAAKNIKPAQDGIEISLYQSVAIRTGKHANNPWLQEMPDPVSKVTWDNYVAVSPRFADENGLKTGDIVTINGKYTLPVLEQPGQAYNTVSIAIGYGKQIGGKAALGTGIRVVDLMKLKNGHFVGATTIEDWKKESNEHGFAMTQTHHSMEGRAIIRETTLEEYIENPAAGNEMHEEIEHHHTTMYDKPEFPGHHWGMAIDLNSCTGCSACLISCSAENNVPVVGKEEVSRAHEMHWIRIDRYYAGNPDNPEVLRQPVMCQHCDNAPCENVCPVAATTHSSEGINQMAYNRCIGTRYCNNNCPYKVRRFNFFDYTKADAIPANTVDPANMTLDISRMVLNPDVTIRAKGVIEKCSFCVQRIQEKKLEAKLDGRTLRDGDIKTACQQACPADAITFGDLNDKNSAVSKMFAEERNYHLLEEIHTLPSVGYLTKVKNRHAEANNNQEVIKTEKHG